MRKVWQALLLSFLVPLLVLGSLGVVRANQTFLGTQLVSPLPVSGHQQLVLGDLDHLGRATFAHIQLQEQDEPQKQRAPRIKYNPVGWHNYKMTYGKHGKKAYLFNRGHLIGYQFSGLTDEARNLVPLTAWTNSGHYKGMDDSNSEGMLYYENRLDSWLATHPNFWLDYRVTPIYSGEELLPRQIALQYVGIDQAGNLLEIRLGSPKEVVDASGVTTVILDNYSRNATIDYLKGTAITSLKQVEPSSQPPARPSSSEGSQAAQEVTSGQLREVVYIARKGNADVYWYAKENMPANTNWANVVEMSEQEALNLGKRHTTKE